MLYNIIRYELDSNFVFFSFILAFLASLILIKVFYNKLPNDLGRKNAINGMLSRGKPRGGGIIFILSFVSLTVVFLPVDFEYICYCIILILTMLSGFFDDRSEKPWGEYKKGLIDLTIALVTSYVVVFFNSEWIGFEFCGRYIEINTYLYMLLATLLVWISINVTNCSDGVDGLCGSVSIVSFLTLYYLFSRIDKIYTIIIFMMVASILGYLWHNVSPSRLLMGDAGSRAIGFFVAILCLKSHNPFIFLFIAFVVILDGGIGLAKIFLMRFFKILFLKKVRTPLHDHVRVKYGWSDTQVVFRFTVIQIFVSILGLSMILK